MDAKPFVLVVGLDLADTASGGFALDQAARIAMRIPGSQMHVVHVRADERSAKGNSNETAGLLRLYVQEKATELGGLARQSVGIHVRLGDSARELAQLATEVGADLIVVGTHKAPHLKSLFVGSTAAHLMAAAHCPVVVAGPRPKAEPSQTIAIESPCPDCLQMRSSTVGRTWWCPRHAESHHLHDHHVYSYQEELPFAEHDSEVTAAVAG
jgi:nucleotide-binding universal stress UspA family protein